MVGIEFATQEVSHDISNSTGDTWAVCQVNFFWRPPGDNGLPLQLDPIPLPNVF